MEATANHVELPSRRSKFTQTPTWPTIAALLLAIVMPLSTALVSLSNRVSVLESEMGHMATAEQVAKQTQKFDDFLEEYRRDQVNQSVNAARNSK